MRRLILAQVLCLLSLACRAGEKPTSGDASAAAPGAARAADAGAAAKTGEPLRVAAAADLAIAFEEVGKAFAQQGGTKPVFSFGSTGLLAKQIQEGAPFDVFAAANVSFVDTVIGLGTCEGDTKALYGRGRIVLWTEKAKGAPPKDLSELADAKYSKIAIANPEHAPYGKAAQQALESTGVWDKVKPKLVFGENVQQTLQFAHTGNVDAAIVALSLAMVSDSGSYTLIDDTKHKPIEQALVVCKNGKAHDQGVAFARFVNSPEGRAIMTRYGFVLPGETATAPTTGGSAPAASHDAGAPAANAAQGHP